MRPGLIWAGAFFVLGATLVSALAGGIVLAIGVALWVATR